MILMLFLLVAADCAAQDDGMDVILKFLGAEAPEEVDEEEAERLASMLDRPLRINQVTMSRLIDSGLLDRYRAASLNDYRLRHGDVLSLMELSLVDGFGEAFVSRLAPFISLETSSVPGERIAGKSKVRTDMTIKAGAKHNDEMLWTSGVKAKLEAGDRFSATFAATSPYGRFDPEELLYSTSLMMRFPKLHMKFIAGDFNARFGQGLVQWNGLSLSSLSAPSAYMKNPVGLTQSSSFTGNYALTGVAAETSLKRFTLSAFLALPGIKKFRISEILPGSNLTYHWRSGQVSATYFSNKSSIDTRWCIKGVDVFAETAYDWSQHSIKALLGSVFPSGEHLRTAAMLRFYPVDGNEYGASVSSEFCIPDRHRVLAVVDAVHLPVPKKDDRGGSTQVKSLLQWEWQTLEWLTVSLRLTERYRTWGDEFRTDMRADMQTVFDAFRVNLRLNALKCRAWGMLSYIEWGYEGKRLTIWMRQGFFRVDDWNDRIYAYERGAPGGFRVPAYYGRGEWTALTVSARFRKAGRLYLRAACTAYPFMDREKRKPGKAELEIQYVCSF